MRLIVAGRRCGWARRYFGGEKIIPRQLLETRAIYIRFGCHRNTERPIHGPVTSRHTGRHLQSEPEGYGSEMQQIRNKFRRSCRCPSHHP